MQIEELPSDADSGHSSGEEDLIAYAKRSLAPGEAILDDSTRELQEPEKKGIYDIQALERKAKEISFPVPPGYKRVPWIETLTLGMEGCSAEDTKQDTLRESKFHGHVETAVKEAYRRLHVMGIPASRPNDFYAEMFKTDAHMYKVRQNIAGEQKKMEVVESRKKRAAEKKFGKQVMHERVKQKMKNRKETKDDMDKWKSKHGNDLGDSDSDSGKKKLPPKQQQKNGSGGVVNKRREAKDAKYGHGGKKRFKKRNTAESFNDPTAMERAFGRGGKGSKKGGKGGKGKGGKGKGGKGGKGVKKGGKRR